MLNVIPHFFLGPQRGFLVKIMYDLLVVRVRATSPANRTQAITYAVLLMTLFPKTRISGSLLKVTDHVTQPPTRFGRLISAKRSPILNWYEALWAPRDALDVATKTKITGRPGNRTPVVWGWTSHLIQFHWWRVYYPQQGTAKCKTSI
jgi:hypothetical protein